MAEPLGTAKVLEKLAKDGYKEDIKSSKKGLKLLSSGIEIAPEDVLVDKIYRFEGQTDLNDEEMIFAISLPRHGLKGTYLVAFGPMMDPQDADMVLRLNKIHKNCCKS